MTRSIALKGLSAKKKVADKMCKVDFTVGRQMADKPKRYRKGKYQNAQCCPSIRDEDGKLLPKAVYIHCEEMNAKDCAKLIEWLKKAKKWIAK
jgi:hypothetical protein